MNTLRKMVKNNKGATAIEYGLIAALIAVAAIAGMNSLGGSLNTAFGTLGAKVGDNIK
ncbi:Flp family type IVb pilin [Sphingomonas sp.]|uniref:Flp family type IVb pilin n=1 Tax=Sphingomonas sp. TaxID=28214 RepID=UPI00289887A1|nr:Flp family type IVb pilin [Sphingomonas sp.]